MYSANGEEHGKGSLVLTNATVGEYEKTRAIVFDSFTGLYGEVLERMLEFRGS